MSLLKYLDFGPVMTAEPPIVCRGADLFVFAVEAKIDALGQLCKRVFNDPSNGEVRCAPLGPWVVIIAGSIAHVSGGNAERPGVREKNVLVHVPVLVETNNAGIFPALFSPFVWVDNPNSMTGGREVFGYAKTYGLLDIDPGDHTANPGSFELTTFGGNKTDDLWDWHKKFIRIHRKGKIPNALFGIMDLVGGVGAVGDLLDSWANTGVKEIFYKQFRDVKDHKTGVPAKACFSQIATAEYVLFGAEAVEPLDHLYELQIGELDSHPIRKQLGLDPSNTSAGYRMKTNFRVEHGSVLWSG